jgi:hypothetical protein
MANENTGSGPFDAYGVPQGGAATETPNPNAALEATVAQLSTKLEAAEKRIAGLPEGFEGATEKLKVVDRIMKAFAGDEQPQNKEQYGAIFQDLKRVAQHAAPGLYKALVLLEANPNAIEQLSQGLDGMALNTLVSLNTQAHSTVIDAAKKAGLTAGMTAAEVGDYVFPYETAITQMIDANKQLKQAFMSGNMKVVEDAFMHLVKPSIAKRMRDKAERANKGVAGFPKAPPRGGAQPGATSEAAPKVNFKDPRARMAFHRSAVNAWADRNSGDRE